MPKISILMPVYNTSRFLRQCLDSVLSQTLSDIEIICINDGSTDMSLEILREYEVRFANMHIIDKKNTGYGNSLNRGISLATGDYVGIVESDDYVDAGMFEHLYSLASQHGCDIVKSNYFENLNDTDVYINNLHGCKMRRPLSLLDNSELLYCSPSIWSGIYRRDFLIKNGILFNETSGASYQDTAFYFKCIMMAKSICLTPEAFLHYRVDNADSSVNSNNKIFCVCDEFDNLNAYLKDRDFPVSILAKLCEVKHSIYCWNLRRISSDYKAEFYQRFIEDFSSVDDSVLADFPSWKNAEALMEVIKAKHFSKQFGVDTFIKHRSNIFIADKIIDYLAHRGFCIYGAGLVAQKAMRMFKKEGLVPDKVVVTHTERHESIYGVEIVAISDAGIQKDETMLVAVSDRYKYEIADMLINEGFKDVILLDEDIIACMNM